MSSQKHKLTAQDFLEISSTEDLRQKLSEKKNRHFKSRPYFRV